jgi:aspartate/methionine/tyrosine aminotransferase
LHNGLQIVSLNQISAEEHILPVSGTREGIFSFVQALIKREDAPYIVMPNPFYQIYEGAALLQVQNHISSTAQKKMVI